MFDFSNVSTPNKVDKDFVLGQISDSMIFGLYYGPFELKKVYPSRFRKDKHSSCGFYVSRRTGKLIYKDIAKDEKYDCFDFVQKLYNLSFQDALNRIAADFGLINGTPHVSAKKVMHDLKDFDKTVKKETRINFSAEKWGVDSLAYWKRFHLGKDDLKPNGIYVIKDLFINGAKIRNLTNEIRYAMTLEYKGEMLTKLYIPESKTDFKWVTNIPTAIPFGLEKLTLKTDSCFIAKAQKCRLVVMKFIPNVIAIQSEQPAAISDEVHSRLQFDYNNLYLGGDNDATGLKFMGQMVSKGYIPAGLPDGYPKDYSDLAEAKGLKAVEKILKEKNII